MDASIQSRTEQLLADLTMAELVELVDLAWNQACARADEAPALTLNPGQIATGTQPARLATVTCPSCRTTSDAVYDMDLGIRWNHGHLDEDQQTLVCNYDGGEFGGSVLLCAGCHQPVSLPGYDVSGY